jgi:hypothetical protein
MVGLKPWYKSKTMWVNLATFFTGVAALLPEVREVVNPDTYTYLLVGIGLINVALRAVTDKGIQ